MDVNSAIIDQNLVSVCEKIRDRAREVLSIKNDEDKLKSLAFVYLCVSTVLDLSDEETFDCLTEGGGEFGIDALYMSEVLDGEFDISLFQGKYKKDKEFSANSNFAETGILKLVNAIKYLFDPHSTVKEINPRLMKKMEEIRSLVSDGLIPNVRVYACNNGIRWNAAGDEHIERAAFGEQVSWEHVNHDTLVSIFQRPKGIDDFIQFTGKATVEDLEFVRVLIGRVAVSEIHDLVQRHGLRMLDRNIRRYLGLKGNRVNEAIRETLIKDDDRNNFYFYNNGITLTCDKFSYNALQGGDFRVRVDNLHIINGGQTCITIHRTLGTQSNKQYSNDAFVLVRLYQLPSDNVELITRITFATNSQNPVDLRDLRSNDAIQQRLEIDISQMGYTYQRKRMDKKEKKGDDITSAIAAEAILSVWRSTPQRAKFLTREHFGQLYSKIFTNELTGAQVIIATLIYRFAENKRRRPPEDAPQFVSYASCFIAMQIGKYLLADLQIDIGKLTHNNFNEAKQIFEDRAEQYFSRAVKVIDEALNTFYREAPSLQLLSATFRRGDLIAIIEQIERQS